ncbi:MAG: 5-formyltetrahydrofolate cyclo-ligase [Clostridiales bacterium]|nr:5-formyltetrahydrofolate cyclo-ligase [Clostridiales bacterium]
MNDITTRKNEVRKQLKEITRGLSEEYMSSASDIIAGKCIESSEFKNADRIFIFVSMKGEPDTTKVIERALEDGKAVYVPRCLGNGIMEAIRLRSFEDLEPGHYGILEPRAGLKPAEPSEYDSETAAAFIPCVAAAKDGKRLGHGAGYYDRFLEGRSMKKLMLVYGKQLLDDIPCDSHDLVMDRVISELDE